MSSLNKPSYDTELGIFLVRFKFKTTENDEWRHSHTYFVRSPDVIQEDNRRVYDHAHKIAENFVKATYNQEPEDVYIGENCILKDCDKSRKIKNDILL